jgi:DnaJ-class molecular chaperone
MNSKLCGFCKGRGYTIHRNTKKSIHCVWCYGSGLKNSKMILEIKKSKGGLK